ncbi:MAG: GIY-YIG nuclease family protein [Bacteroidales bacterium]|nr:GIY-YIG nuclease family protein [Bacteroidales bacterium]
MPRRWEEHITGKGADWTKRNKPVYIAHYEIFKSRKEAVNREKELKTTSGRRWIKEQIANGTARQAGGIPFEEKMESLTSGLAQQMDEEKRLDEEIKLQDQNLEVTKCDFKYRTWRKAQVTLCFYRTGRGHVVCCSA